MKPERRYTIAEVRSTGGDKPKIAGHAAIFNTRSQNLGGFVEIIAPGAFDKCLASNPDILGLFNHDMMAVPLGRTPSGTLRVWVDSVGLAYEIDPPGTTLSNDLMLSLSRKDVRGSSFGFYCLKDSWEYDTPGDIDVRTVLEADVFDVSPVTNPAYLQADSALRAQMPQNDAQLRELVAERRRAREGSRAGSLTDDELRGLMLRQDLLLHLAGR